MNRYQEIGNGLDLVGSRTQQRWDQTQSHWVFAIYTVFIFILIFIFMHTPILTFKNSDPLYDTQMCKYLQNQGSKVPQTQRATALPVAKVMVTNMFFSLNFD